MYQNIVWNIGSHFGQLFRICFIPCPTNLEGGGNWIYHVRLSVCRRQVFQGLTPVYFEFQFQISYECFLWLWAEAYWFWVISLTKWPSGGYIVFSWFPTSNLSLASQVYSKLQLHIHNMCVWVQASWLWATSLAKWPPGGHIGFLFPN